MKPPITKFSDLPAERRAEIVREINEHHEILRSLLSTSADHARKYLTFANGGSAVALLAFMGSNPDLRSATFALLALGLFAAGTIFVGILAALDYQASVAAFNDWAECTRRLYAGEIDYPAMSRRAHENADRWAPWAPAAGYVSFGCFIAGSTIAIIGFLTSSA